ncbi:hypothetical protein [Bacillus sp. JCM 19041]|uniref:hypothetical protein n=1 Tax=Bacillus sp. JCM 19041 TaxID=1460637 RepID=UPI0006D146F6
MEELYLNGPRALEMREAQPLPVLKENEVKIRLIYGGICGSDLSVYKASFNMRHTRFGQVMKLSER